MTISLKLHKHPAPTAKSCATCRHWRQESGKPWCPQAAAWLPPREMTQHSCPLWLRERYESDAVELYERLSNGT